MNESICSEFIQHLDQHGSLECGRAPEHIIAWIDDLNLPDGLARFMMHNWPQADGFITHIRISSSLSLYADEATGPLLKHKFLNAGFAPNGDWFVIDFSTETCRPGFVTLCEWTPWLDEPTDPRRFFEPIARSFESFLYRVVERLYLPTDSYAAKEFNEFLTRERRNEHGTEDAPHQPAV